MKLSRIARELGLPTGYRLVATRGGHLSILTPDGEPLRSPTGQALRVSSTPSDHRCRLNEATRVRRAIKGGGS